MPESPLRLPSLTASDFFSDNSDGDGQQASDAVDIEREGEDGDVYYQEAPSMTLRDILIRAADITQLDLLDDDVQLRDESCDWG